MQPTLQIAFSLRLGCIKLYQKLCKTRPSESLYGDASRKMPINSGALTFFSEKVAYFHSRKSRVTYSLPTRFFYKVGNELYMAYGTRGRRALFTCSIRETSKLHYVVAPSTAPITTCDTSVFQNMDPQCFFTAFFFGIPFCSYFLTPNFTFMFHD